MDPKKIFAIVALTLLIIGSAIIAWNTGDEEEDHSIIDCKTMTVLDKNLDTREITTSEGVFVARGKFYNSTTNYYSMEFVDLILLGDTEICFSKDNRIETILINSTLYVRENYENN